MRDSTAAAVPVAANENPPGSTETASQSVHSPSLSILRQFLRFAVSSIVYHRMNSQVQLQSHVGNTVTNGGSGSGADSGEEDKNGLCHDVSAPALGSIPTPSPPSLSPSSPAFVDRDYCGSSGSDKRGQSYKFMDPVARDGTILDPNGKKSIGQAVRKIFLYIHTV